MLSRIADYLGVRRQRLPEAADRIGVIGRLRMLARLSARKRMAHEGFLLSTLTHADPDVRAEAARVVRFAYTFQELEERLRGGRSAVAAAELLGALDHDGVVEVLFSLAAQAEGSQVRQAAVRGLRQQPVEPVVSAALQRLDGDQATRDASAAVLRALGEPALRLLMAALSAPRRQVRLGAIRALEIIGGERAASAVAQVIRDPAEEVRAEAVRVLAALRPGTVDDGVLSCLADPAMPVRLQAATALAKADTAAAGSHVARFLQACSDDPGFEVADQEFLASIAVMKSLPQEAFLSLLNGRNQSFAVSLALALEESGTLDSWLAALPAAEPAAARHLKELLRAAAGLGAREPFLRALEAPAARVRAFAAHVIGECRYEEAAPALGLLLTDEDPDVRRTVLAALVRIQPSQGAAAAIEALGDPSPKVRGAAVSALAAAASLGGLKSGSQLALPPASGAGLAVRRTYGLPVAMSQALGKLALSAGPEGDPEGRDALLSGSAAIGRALRDPSPHVRAKAARALGEIGAGTLAHALVERALNDDDADVRAACAQTMGRSPSAEVSEALCRALREGHVEMRRRAATAVESLGDPSSAPTLLNALQDPDSEVRRLAGRALWAIADTAMGEVLLEHLHSPDPAVRAAIAGLLGKVRAPYALEPVASRLEDPHPRVRAAAVNALGAMGEAALPALPRLAAALTDPDPFVRVRAADALGRMGAAAAAHVARILHALDDDDETVRAAVRRCAVGLANQGALTPFVEALRDDLRRDRARRVLMQVELPVMRILLRMAYDVNSTVGEQLLEIVAEALRRRGSFDECRSDLLSLDPTVRLSGLEALGLMATPEAVAFIAQAMQNDPLPSLRARAAEILEAIQPPASAPASLPPARELPAP